MSSPLTAIQEVRAALVADSALVALVPTARMYPQSLPITPVTPTYPCLVYSALDESDMAFADDLAQAELALVEVQVWVNAGTSTTAIAQNVARIMRVAGWVREYSQDFTYKDGQVYKIMRYSKMLSYS